MDREHYLHEMGCLELIASGLTIIAGFIGMIYATIAMVSLGAIGVFLAIVAWFEFAFVSFCLPAVGICFLTVADLLHDMKETMEKGRATAKRIGVNPGDPSSVEHLRERVKLLEEKLANLGLKEPGEALEQKTGNQVSEDSTFVLTEDEQASNTETIEEALPQDVNLDSEGVTVGKDKNSYLIDEKVRINQDVVIDGKKVKKGSLGIIDNRMVTTKGRVYVVLLEKPKRTIQITGDYFD